MLPLRRRAPVECEDRLLLLPPALKRLREQLLVPRGLEGGVGGTVQAGMPLEGPPKARHRGVGGRWEKEPSSLQVGH